MKDIVESLAEMLRDDLILRSIVLWTKTSQCQEQCQRWTKSKKAINLKRKHITHHSIMGQKQILVYKNHPRMV